MYKCDWQVLLLYMVSEMSKGYERNENAPTDASTVVKGQRTALKLGRHRFQYFKKMDDWSFKKWLSAIWNVLRWKHRNEYWICMVQILKGTNLVAFFFIATTPNQQKVLMGAKKLLPLVIR